MKVNTTRQQTTVLQFKLIMDDYMQSYGSCRPKFATQGMMLGSWFRHISVFITPSATLINHRLHFRLEKQCHVCYVYPVIFLSTHADRQGVNISFTVCVCVSVCLFVCTVTDFSAEDKASGVKFCTTAHRRQKMRISHFCELCSPKAQNRTNPRGPRAGPLVR